MRRGKSETGPFPFRARPNRTAIPVRAKNQNGPLQSTGLSFVPAQTGETERALKKFVIETRIHSGLRFHLLILIGRTRDRRAGLIPHLLTSGLIPSLMVCLS
jgi:hypothetical protein